MFYGSSDVTTKYCYDGDQVIAEYDGSDNLLWKFIYGPDIDEPICMIDVADSNAVYYYHIDGLGSMVALSDVNNVIVESGKALALEDLSFVVGSKRMKHV